MEPVGVGLSVLALFIECVKTYRLFSMANYLSKDFKILQTKSKIEETRLTQWGLYWGYRPSSTECRLEDSIDSAGQHVASTVRLTLLQISTQLKRYAAVSEKYETVRRGSQAYRGMVWAIKDKEELESTIKNLTDFNNALHQLLPKKKEVSLGQAVACAVTTDSNGDDLDNIIAVASSLQYVDAAKLARFKKAYQMLTLEEEKLTLNPPAPALTLQMDEGRVQLSTRHTTKFRTLANLDSNKRVLVEWKSYHPSMLSGSQTARTTLRNRVSHLAELMSSRTPRPEEFKILTCVGYFDQGSSERFGFAHEFPPNVVHHMPFTLHELFTSCGAPALGTRFRLALSLSKTLNLLLSCTWLHKSVRSNNIAIFQATATNEPRFEMPYLLGFGYSRPDGYGEETFLEQSAATSCNQLYRHPEVQGQHPRRYRASDDIYSLGLVLLEIALWMPLVKIDGRKENDGNNVPLNVDKVKASLSSLPRRVGSIYTAVVEKCLDLNGQQWEHLANHDQSAAEWNSGRLRNQNRVFWDVVNELEKCNA